jgi:phage shock protein A
MGILTRMARLCKADLHGVMDSLEDRQLLLRQHLREMEEALARMEAEIGRAAAARREMEEEMARRANAIAKLERDLTVAVEKEKDDIARMLIRRLQPLRAHQSELERRIETACQCLVQQRGLLDARRLQYDQLKLKSSLFDHNFRPEHWDAGLADEAVQRPSEEEIELELMQLKEAQASGGAA